MMETLHWEIISKWRKHWVHLAVTAFYYGWQQGQYAPWKRWGHHQSIFITISWLNTPLEGLLPIEWKVYGIYYRISHYEWPQSSPKSTFLLYVSNSLHVLCFGTNNCFLGHGLKFPKLAVTRLPQRVTDKDRRSVEEPPPVPKQPNLRL